MLKKLFALETKANLIPYTVSRIAIGAFFLITGFNKLFNPTFQASMLKTITSIGFPYPQFTANFAAANEAIFGLLLAVGLFTRFSAFVLNIVLFVALFTFDLQHLPTGLDPFTWYSYFAYLPQVLYLLFLFNAWAIGGGPLSIDAFLVRRKRRIG
ncbi:DoxX family protein [Sphingobacterium sp. MYb382]|uniref:DoxX family protein n=1 Tax=Sphingobacterium sp. MYb382 TaxID=2745278 RepID=UPI0030B57D02